MNVLVRPSIWMAQQVPELIVPWSRNTVHCIYTKGSDKEMTYFLLHASSKLVMLKFHSTSLQDSWRYGCFKIYFLFILTVCFHCWTRQYFPSPYKYLPASATACARRSEVPRRCGNVVIAGFYQTTVMMTSVRHTVCVAWCCPGGKTFRTYFICKYDSTKSSIMTSVFFQYSGRSSLLSPRQEFQTSDYTAGLSWSNGPPDSTLNPCTHFRTVVTSTAASI